MKPFDFYERWAELFFVILLVVGFVISIIAGSAFFNYIIIFLCGVMAGRVLQVRKGRVPYYLIVFGFLIGYVLGKRYGNWRVIIFLFIIGTVISFYLHEKEYIR